MRPRSILVIGYGNDLRGDDAAGPCAAAEISDWKLPWLQVLVVHQLVPELADPLAAADCAIFLDAHAAPAVSGLLVQRLQPTASSSGLDHTTDPQGLLALARTAFGRAPEAWWITIPAVDFSFGAPLSPLARGGIAEALDRVRLLVEGMNGDAVSVLPPALREGAMT
jgi:hydrogenase maturation protease